jgi:hypothetical protein
MGDCSSRQSRRVEPYAHKMVKIAFSMFRRRRTPPHDAGEEIAGAWRVFRPADNRREAAGRKWPNS